MLSSTPFMDNFNNEWTLSLLPYGLADFAPKDLTDKATVRVRKGKFLLTNSKLCLARLIDALLF